jgi:hypothetical protein
LPYLTNEAESFDTYINNHTLLGIAAAACQLLDFGGEETKAFIKDARLLISNFSQAMDALLLQHEEKSTFIDNLAKQHGILVE